MDWWQKQIFGILSMGGAGHPHVARVSRIVEAELTPEVFARPPEFQLESFWENWCREYESQPPFCARVRVAPEALPCSRSMLVTGHAVNSLQRSIPDADGWVTLELPFKSFVAARSRLLGLGRAVECPGTGNVAQKPD